MTPIGRPRRLVVLLAIGALTLAAGAGLLLLESSRLRADVEAGIETATLEHAQTLERSISMRVRDARTLGLLMSREPDMPQAQFSENVTEILADTPGLFGAFALREETITDTVDIGPGTGEGASHVDYIVTHAELPALSAFVPAARMIGQPLNIDQAGPSIRMAMEDVTTTGETTVFGPIDFDQLAGLRALFALYPVDSPADSRAFVVLLLNFDGLLNDAGIGDAARDGLVFSLEVSTGVRTGALEREVVLGAPETLPSGAYAAEVSAPGTTWTLWGAPADGLPWLSPLWLVIIGPILLAGAAAGVAADRRGSERERLERRVHAATLELQAARAHDHALFTYSPAGVLDVEQDGHVRAMNAAAREILRSDGVGHQLGDLLPGVEPRPTRSTRTLELADGTDSRWIEIDAVEWESPDLERGLLVSVRDMTDARKSQEVLRRYTAELETVTNQLKEIDQFRSDLVSMVSHEVRTPMTAIRGFSELLAARWRELPNDQVDELLAGLRRHGDRLWILVSDLLQTAQIERGGLSTPSSPESVRRTLGYVIERVGAGDGIEVIGQDADVLVPPEDLTAMLRALITNAAKYGAAPILIELRVEQETMTVDVIDHGPGIQSDQAHHVFERFWQATTGNNRTATGIGLGLHMARSLARLHGGDLVLRSFANPTVFRLTLPTVLLHPSAGASHGADTTAS